MYTIILNVYYYIKKYTIILNVYFYTKCILLNETYTILNSVFYSIKNII